LDVKTFLKSLAVLLIGIGVGFGLWEAFGHVPLILWVAILGAIPTLVGVEMTVNPPTNPKSKGMYRAIFSGWFVAILVTGYLQYEDSKPVIPKLPEIRIETFSGLPDGMTNNPHLRYHRLQIRNNNEIGIDNICSRLQLPEPIVVTLETNFPPGTVIDWHPITTKVTIDGTGTRNELGVDSTANYLLSPPCFFPEGNKGQLSGYFDSGDNTECGKY